jgi:hypothetical protein
MDPDIYRLVSDATNNKSNVRFLNTYRGVPVTADGNVIELHGNDVKFQTTAIQILCIRAQKYSYINFGDFILKGRVISSNLNDETIILTDLEPNKNIIGLRKFIRIEPFSPVKVRFTSPRFNTVDSDVPVWFIANLVDLSIHGAAIHLNAFVYKQTPVYVNDSGMLKFTLTEPKPMDPIQFETATIVKNIRYFDERLVRIGLQTFPDINLENTLTHYVAHLQKIIIQELRERLDKGKSIYS